MIIRKSLKQLFRTPLTTTLFIVLMTAAAFFLCAGVVIWARNQATIKAYEDTFMTIGTVQQKPDKIVETQRWNAFQERYSRLVSPHYNAIYKSKVLSFADAEYILQPEKRPYYGAWMPEYKLIPDDTEDARLCQVADRIIEFTPLEDCVPNKPVEVRINRIFGDSSEYGLEYLEDGMSKTDFKFEEGEVIPLCDHRNDDPKMLYAGRKYIACIDFTFHDSDFTVVEYRIYNIEFSTQYTQDGTLIDGIANPPNIQEVTDGFYYTPEGKCWINYADAMYKPFKTVPVIPTQNTDLMIPFYNKSSFIVDGENITEEEYEVGEYVCLVSSSFAEWNNISVGDSIRMPLYYANYGSSPMDNGMIDYSFGEYERGTGTVSKGYGGGPLNADGEPYEVFSDHEYVVKGIYFNIPSRNDVNSLGGNVVIVPANSIRESDENNILAWGPMTNANTSFQIPNGSIESFMEKWLQQPHAEDLQLTFYDRGYTQVQRGIANMKRMSTLFLTIGGVLALVLVLYFCNMFITKNKSRTAIERMLGYTKRQCAVSLLSGFMLCALIAAVLGCGSSMVFEDKLTSSLLNKEYYDTTFTIGAVDMDVEVEAGDSSLVTLACPAAGVLLLAATFGVGCIFMHGNLKEEPLVMLGKKVE